MNNIAELNKHSILERKKLSDLFDADAKSKERIQFKGKEVDAVSGATKKEIKASVIEGALYSCYTIWHLVHGDVEDKIKNQLQAMYSPVLETNLLYSGYPSYQFYALRQLDAQSFEQNIDRILQLFSNSKPLIRIYILKKMPKSLWAEKEVANQPYRSFPEIDINSRTLLINNLEQAPSLTHLQLANHLTLMTKNQLKSYLGFFNNNPESLSIEGK